MVLLSIPLRMKLSQTHPSTPPPQTFNSFEDETTIPGCYSCWLQCSFNSFEDETSRGIDVVRLSRDFPFNSFEDETTPDDVGLDAFKIQLSIPLRMKHPERPAQSPVIPLQLSIPLRMKLVLGGVRSFTSAGTFNSFEDETNGHHT